MKNHVSVKSKGLSLASLPLTNFSLQCAMPCWDRNVGECAWFPGCSRYTFCSDWTEFQRVLTLQLKHLFILRVKDLKSVIICRFHPHPRYHVIMAIISPFLTSSCSNIQLWNQKKCCSSGPLTLERNLPLIIIIGSLLRHKYGSPLSRRRLYLFFFRKDILKKEARSYNALFDMMKQNLTRMHVKEKVEWHLANKNIS